LDRAHVREIHRFFDRLPTAIPAEERGRVESFLANLAAELSPDQLRKAADKLATVMGSEDEFTDNDRARRRGFTWSHQDADGMSKATLWATPALRAELDAILAAWAAPGKCNPEDESPCIDGEPDPQAVERDSRSPAQRRHDALSAVSRAICIGRTRYPQRVTGHGHRHRHTARPQGGTGQAFTGGGTAVPMPDVIRMASHSYLCLTLFDAATEVPLWLGKTRRVASAGQRIVMHAKDRGCSFPGCTLPGYFCQVHHAITDWVNGGRTNIDELTFACPAHHALATNAGWTTRKNLFGHTEWIPPPQLELPGGINNYHHPERYLD
jgi:Domain of unknown function (DUF222)